MQNNAHVLSRYCKISVTMMREIAEIRDRVHDHT